MSILDPVSTGGIDEAGGASVSSPDAPGSTGSSPPSPPIVEIPSSVANCPKIVYPSGGGSELNFQYPPRMKPWTDLRATRHDNVASSGVVERIFERIDEFLNITMEYVKISGDIPAWDAFIRQALTGISFDYYPDSGANVFAPHELESTSWAPGYKSLGMFTFSILCRKVGDDMALATLVPSYAYADLPGGSAAGSIARVTDRTRGMWMYTGAVWFALNGGIANVREFGAVGDGFADDTAAFNAAIDAVLANVSTLPGFNFGGGVVYVPDGFYRLTSTLVKSTAQSFILRGAGSEKVFLDWTTNDHGIQFEYTDILNPPTFEGLTFISSNLATKTGLRITGPAGIGRVHGPVVRDCHFKGYNEGLMCWNIGVELVSCWYPLVENCSVKGQDSVHPFAATAGVKFTTCQVYRQRDLIVLHTQWGVLGTGVNEGCAIENGDFLGVDTCVEFNGSPSMSANFIKGITGNSELFGIKIANANMMTISHCQLGKTQVGLSDFVSIQLNSCHTMRVLHNEVGGWPSGTGYENPIVLIDVIDSVIADNVVRLLTVGSAVGFIGILVGTSCGNNSIHDNIGDSTVVQMVRIQSDALTTNHYHANFPSGDRGSFTMGAAASQGVTSLSVQSTSMIVLTPTNAAATALMRGTHALRVSAKTLNSGFTVATEDGGNAVGTETFQFEVLN